MFPILLPLLFQAAVPQAVPKLSGEIGPPPLAADVRGEIEQVMLSPLYRTPFSCMEHPAGTLEYAGDALGTDCAIEGGITSESGFSTPYRKLGKDNGDWYGWHADVLAPVSGVVLGLLENPNVNVPGTMGRPPAGMIRFLTEDGIIVVYGHVTDFQVKAGEKVTPGQVVGKVGNNGVSRAPHIHVGAYRATDNVPLQIRWDLQAMAKLADTPE